MQIYVSSQLLPELLKMRRPEHHGILSSTPCGPVIRYRFSIWYGPSRSPHCLTPTIPLSVYTFYRSSCWISLLISKVPITSKLLSITESCISHEKTMWYTPQSIGVAERMNCTLAEKTRSLHHGVKLPYKLWAEAWNTAQYLYAKSPVKAHNSMPEARFKSLKGGSLW